MQVVVEHMEELLEIVQELTSKDATDRKLEVGDCEKLTVRSDQPI